MMRVLFFLFISTLNLIGCRNYYSIRSVPIGETPGDQEVESWQIDIDGTYDFYARTVHQIDTVVYENDSLNLGPVNIKVMETNLEVQPIDKGLLIEVGFLMISQEKGRAIYITTVPDIYKSYYSSYCWTGLNRPNMHDFRSFHFGKLSGNNIVFQSKDTLSKDKDTWTITKNEEDSSINLITIREDKRGKFVSMVLVEESFAKKVWFQKLNDKTDLIYFNPNNRSLTTAPTQLSTNTFYIKKWTSWGLGGKKDKYSLHVEFLDSKGQPKEASFKDKRIRYIPYK